MIEELLEIFLEGAQAPAGNSRQVPGVQDHRQQSGSTQNSQVASNPWLDLLEDFMGGQQPQIERPQAEQPQAELPQGRVPSRQPTEAVGGFGIDDLLEIFMGDGQKSNVGGNPMLAPFTEALSEKLGLSPQLASIIVSYAFSMLLSRLGSGGTTRNSGVQSQPQQAKGGLDLDDLLDGDFMKSQDMGKKIAKRTGLDEKTAQESLREAMKILSGKQDIEEPPKPRVEQPQSAKASQEQRSLQGLLDTWED